MCWDLLLQIFCWFWRWKKLENWSIFDEVWRRTKSVPIFGPPCIWRFVLPRRVTLWPWSLTVWPWWCTVPRMADLHRLPDFVILWLSVTDLWITEFDHIFDSGNSHCTMHMRRVMWPIVTWERQKWSSVLKSLTLIFLSALSLSVHYDEH